MEFAFAAAAIFVASFVQGLTGFGSGIIALTLLAMMWEIQFVVAITAVFSIFICLYLAWRLWEHIRFSEILPLLAGAAIGVPLGVMALTRLDPRIIKGCLGVFLMAYAAWSLLSKEQERPPISKTWAFPSGMGAGLLSGAFNTGGPPVVLYGNERQWSPNAFRGNIQGFFAPCAALTLTLYALNGVITRDTLAWNLKLFPFLIVGMVIGDRLAAGVQPGPFRKILLLSLLAVGVVFLRAFFLPDP